MSFWKTKWVLGYVPSVLNESVELFNNLCGFVVKVDFRQELGVQGVGIGM